MPSRNTATLTGIVTALGDLVSSPTDSLARLEQHFQNVLLVNAGATRDVANFAEQLRLAITTDECAQVLDYRHPQARHNHDRSRRGSDQHALHGPIHRAVN